MRVLVLARQGHKTPEGFYKVSEGYLESIYTRYKRVKKRYKNRKEEFIYKLFRNHIFS